MKGNAYAFVYSLADTRPTSDAVIKNRGDIDSVGAFGGCRESESKIGLELGKNLPVTGRLRVVYLVDECVVEGLFF